MKKVTYSPPFLRSAAIWVLLALNAPMIAMANEDAEMSSIKNDPLTTMFEMFRWEGMIASFFVILASWVVLRFADRVVEKLGSVFADRRLLIQKISAFFHFAVYIATIFSVVLLSFKISKEILVILSGTGAVALGFALKDLAASLMAGIMIMFDRPFQVGDRINFGDQYGDVIAIGLRSVKLQTLDDSTVTIPNNMFLGQVTSCGNYGVVDMQIMVDFHIGIDQDVVKAREIIQEVAANTRFIYLPKPIKVIVSQVVIDSCVALRLRLKAYVLDTKYEKDFETDITLHVMKLFGENGIQPPAILHRQVEKPYLINETDTKQPVSV
ncbi:mechanosensitive ion channel family protein [Alkalimarinus sediminis]|uniref:Small-conductance mechanosensitive channel n=1 Tax=Alkalimarinus sediminis TaxID=1632866 RepID=A0A9E8KIC1_9ALTE|nr:mechanosensitive ion channel domain-containing protein [Alkalimarinus sediminis]UZW73791.1 mechanosensitive ion channel family protein [Alkalimarinus sediminis]